QDAHEPHDTGRESGRRAKKPAWHGMTLLQETIPQNAHLPSAVETLLDPQHGVRRASFYHSISGHGIQVTDDLTHQRRILFVHQNLDLDIPQGQPDGTHDLEAPEMRTEQDTPLPTSPEVSEQVESLYIDVEAA